MDAGRMNRRVTIERPETTLDAAGEADVTFVPVGTVWAEVRPVRGNESFSTMQRYAEVTHRFRIRHRDDLTPEYRLLYQQREFDITEVLEVGRREGMDILAIARAE